MLSKSSPRFLILFFLFITRSCIRNSSSNLHYSYIKGQCRLHDLVRIEFHRPSLPHQLQPSLSISSNDFDSFRFHLISSKYSEVLYTSTLFCDRLNDSLNFPPYKQIGWIRVPRSFLIDTVSTKNCCKNCAFGTVFTAKLDILLLRLDRLLSEWD